MSRSQTILIVEERIVERSTCFADTVKKQKQIGNFISFGMLKVQFQNIYRLMRCKQIFHRTSKSSK
jgi:hypothetical protein